jgi:hypothetical protein
MFEKSKHSSIVDELFRRGVNRLASAVAADYLEKRAKVVSSFTQFTQRHRPVGRQKTAPRRLFDTIQTFCTVQSKEKKRNDIPMVIF